MSDQLPRLYTDLADWFHLLTAPDDYAEEAAFYLRELTAALGAPPRSLLELGSGGGNNAFHYKMLVGQVTLVDPAPGMLALSQSLNPECEHILGDMRDVRLQRVFDAVFVQDAVDYMTTEADLRRAMTTAFVHTRPGGAALFAPDHTRENFTLGEDTEHGGHDGQGRAMRYLSWAWDPDPRDTTYLYEFAYLLHEDGQPTRSAYDRHVCGLFSRADWLRLLGEVGFQAQVRPFEHSEVAPGAAEVFVCARPPHSG